VGHDDPRAAAANPETISDAPDPPDAANPRAEKTMRAMAMAVFTLENAVVNALYVYFGGGISQS
jgi:hypothetical protein